MSKLVNIFKLSVPLTILAVFSVWSFLSFLFSLSLAVYVFGLICLVFYVSGLNSFNGCFDTTEDEISKPTRATVTKEISIFSVLIISSSFLVISFIASLFLSSVSTLIIVLWIILALTYSIPPFRLKKRFLVNTLIISSNYAILPFLLASFNSFSPTFDLLIPLFLVAFFLTVVKDFEDAHGDDLVNNLTFPAVFGKNITRLLVLGGSFISISWFINSLNLFYLFSGLLLITLFIFIITLNHTLIKGKYTNAILFSILYFSFLNLSSLGLKYATSHFLL